MMMIDPNKQRKIIVVHGVQTGDNDDLHQDTAVKELFNSRLGELDIDVAVDLYKYENLNNAITDPLEKLISYMIANPVTEKLTQAMTDIIGDVLISLGKNSTSEQIRQNLEDKIMAYYDAGHPVYVVAHSLGTVYSFDVINRLMKRDDLFNPDDMLTWPILSWLTLGSPLGLDMFKNTGRETLSNLGAGKYWFRWRNYFDENDPVVSGNIFGANADIDKIAEAYKKENDYQKWRINDYPVNTGTFHLAAHVAYWKQPEIGDGLVEMLTE